MIHHQGRVTFERFLAQSECAQGWWDVCGTLSNPQSPWAHQIRELE